MLKLPCVKRVKFDSCMVTKYGAAGKYTPLSMQQIADGLSPEIEHVEAGTELEDISKIMLCTGPYPTRWSGSAGLIVRPRGISQSSLR